MALRARLRPPGDANVALCHHGSRECPVEDVIMADFGYVRRHGTRLRYGGTYTDRMLATDAGCIRRWRRAGRDVYVYFNNDGGAFAVKNALRLSRLTRAD